MNVLGGFSIQKRTVVFMENDLYSHIYEEEALTCGLRQFHNSKVTPVWLCFAAQIFLDIHHLLPHQVGKSFRSLQSIAMYARELLAKTIDFISQSLNFYLDPVHDESSRTTSLVIELEIWRDFICDSRHAKLGSKYVPDKVEPFHLVSQHPLLCGMK